MVPEAVPSAPFPSPVPLITRRVRIDDFARVYGLSALVPPALSQAISSGTASAALDAAEHGTQHFHEVLADAHARGFSAAVSAVSMVLIAHDSAGRHAVLIAEPAVKAFRQPDTFTGHLQLERLTLVFAAEVTAITAPASSELGSALLHAAADIYSRAGFALLYGTAAAPAGSLAPAPFRTTGAGKALCLDPAFLQYSIGLATVNPEPGTLIYYADLQGRIDAEWEYPIDPGEDRPVAVRGDHPVTERGDHPVTERGDHPVTEREDHPVTERGKEPGAPLRPAPGLAFGG